MPKAQHLKHSKEYVEQYEQHLLTLYSEPTIETSGPYVYKTVQ